MPQLTHYTVYGVDVDADSRLDRGQVLTLAKQHLEAQFNATFLAYIGKDGRLRVRPERCDKVKILRESKRPTLTVTNRAGTQTAIRFAEGADPSMFDKNAREALDNWLYDPMFIGLSPITNKPYVD